MYPEYSPHTDIPTPAPVGGRPDGAWPDDGLGEPPPAGSRRARRLSRSRRRIVTALAVLAFLSVPAVAGYEVGQRDGSGDSDAATALVPDASPNLPDGGSTIDDGSTGSTGSTGGSDASSAELASVVDEVDDVVVNITSDVDGGGQAAGTGIVISADGLAVTNAHVISRTTGLTVEFAATGQTRPAKVLGYSVVDDIALIQILNVRDLVAAEIGSSSSLGIGETIIALGNAGGRGGTPAVASGTVTALEQEITASDSDGSNSQTLDGLIQVAADIRSGDSGGPVVDTDGRVVGVTVAASVANQFGFPGSGGEGYAIPIEDAIAIVKKIASGEGGVNIRVGANRAMLGVAIQPTLTNQRSGGGSGVRILEVESGSGAADAGLEAGDTIVALDGESVGSTEDLTRIMVQFDPGESIEVTVRTADGDTRTVEIELGEGPPA